MRIERVIRRRFRVDDARGRLVADLDAAVAANVAEVGDGSAADRSETGGVAASRSRSRTTIVQRGRAMRAQAPAAQEETDE